MEGALAAGSSGTGTGTGTGVGVGLLEDLSSALVTPSYWVRVSLLQLMSHVELLRLRLRARARKSEKSRRRVVEMAGAEQGQRRRR